MNKTKLPLQEISINNIFENAEGIIYEIPIYQRNYAWEKDEITALIQDVYDAFCKKELTYYIGTLVSYDKGDNVYEIIDGQQRLTTIRLVLAALNHPVINKLTYRARKKSDDTLNHIPDFKIDEKDSGIVNGYYFAKTAISEIVPEDETEAFTTYFCNSVHIIHYQVPKDIDLNHYFEVMNSRGEQLEKPEIIKANLMQQLSDDDERNLFNHIWNCCSEMNVYMQQSFLEDNNFSVFGPCLNTFIPTSFNELKKCISPGTRTSNQDFLSITDILDPNKTKWITGDKGIYKKESFLSIIDFPNFLLIVLKITRMNESDFIPKEFNLDDKELINEFSAIKNKPDSVRLFAYNLLKARFLLDNYIVHHTKEEDSIDTNPWNLQVWTKDEEGAHPKNLIPEQDVQDKLVHLLSMFEVSFTAKQRKNYLFYCLYYLMNNNITDFKKYTDFVESLSNRYFNKVYLNAKYLNSINTPIPGSFDDIILNGKTFDASPLNKIGKDIFVQIYGDGTKKSKGVPLFIFNYLDYKIWKLYAEQLRGEKLKEGSKERNDFFDILGCSDFGLKIFDRFYFSRTRRSLEHYYPQAAATGINGALNEAQINCIGNYGMIGSEANSSGSNWSPKTKLDHYLDSSGKINQISVASLKFMIMMQICKDKQKWDFDDILNHQNHIISILLDY